MNNQRDSRDTYQKKPYENKFDFENKGYRVNGIIRAELITTEAEKIAGAFLEDPKNRLSSSQLRAFFNEVKGINNRIGDSKENFILTYPLILMLKSKAEYRGASKGATQKMPKVFKDFILKNVDRIIKDNENGEGLESFQAFVMFFEAVVGYFYGKGGR